MAIQYEFFIISAGKDEVEEFNKFLRSVKVINIHREFVNNNYPCWYFAVEYMSKGEKDNKKRIDYKGILTDKEFEVFLRLKDWRKEIAKQEGIQLYLVFNNDQLAEMIQKRVVTKAGLKAS